MCHTHCTVRRFWKMAMPAASWLFVLALSQHGYFAHVREEKPGLHCHFGLYSDLLLPEEPCFTRNWRNREKALAWLLQEQQAALCHLLCRPHTWRTLLEEAEKGPTHQLLMTLVTSTGSLPPGHCRGGLLFKTLLFEPGICLPAGVCRSLALALHRDTS